uniref:Uncharacterized protein n=1 Tax=Arundo donax TaxID=35708 RepID=A0A0A9E8G5_ARUDO
MGLLALGPTVVYIYDNVSSPYTLTRCAYVEYSSELDALNSSLVNWRPYFDKDVLTLPLNSLCRCDEVPPDLAPPMRCPLWVELHKFDRVQKRKIIDFVLQHREYIQLWNRME